MSSTTRGGVAGGALRFWSTWLLVAFLLQALVGYLVAFLLHTPLWEWHQGRVGLALWGSSAYPPEVEAYRRWVAAVLGATMASWGVALAWVAAVPFARGERWAWWCIATSALAWAPFDTGASLLHGVYVNALFNAVPVVMMAVPLAATWRRFFRSAAPQRLEASFP